MDSLELLMYLSVIIFAAFAVCIIAIAILLITVVRGRNWKAGVVPTAEEIANKKIADLANRLKSDSINKTLTNILEWQERNLTFWLERFPMPQIFWAFLIGLIVSSVFLYTGFISRLNDLFYDSLVFSALFLGMVVAFLIVMLVTICCGRGLKVNQFRTIFRSNIPVDEIIENRLCVCRDYAKLTACLLLNLPESEVFFVHTSNHAAVGVFSNNQLYILDQKLPILTMSQWDKREKSKEKIHKFRDGKTELINNTFKASPDDTNHSGNDRKEYLKSELARLLGLPVEWNNNEIKAVRKVKWKHGANLYRLNDDLVNYSLARKIQKIISEELVDSKKVTIIIQENEHNDNLEFLISYDVH
jgi:predicted transglutaminase-like protease